METFNVRDILKFPDGTPLERLRGKPIWIGEWEEKTPTDKEKKKFTTQSIILADADAEKEEKIAIPVNIVNKPEIPQDQRFKIMFFKAKDGDRGLTGVKMDSYQKKGETVKQVRVTATATVEYPGSGANEKKDEPKTGRTPEPEGKQGEFFDEKPPATAGPSRSDPPAQRPSRSSVSEAKGSSGKPLNEEERTEMKNAHNEVASAFVYYGLCYDMAVDLAYRVKDAHGIIWGVDDIAHRATTVFIETCKAGALRRHKIPSRFPPFRGRPLCELVKNVEARGESFPPQPDPGHERGEESQQEGRRGEGLTDEERDRSRSTRDTPPGDLKEDDIPF